MFPIYKIWNELKRSSKKLRELFIKYWSNELTFIIHDQKRIQITKGYNKILLSLLHVHIPQFSGFYLC